MASATNTTRRAFLSSIPGFAAAGALAVALPAVAARPEPLDLPTDTLPSNVTWTREERIAYHAREIARAMSKSLPGETITIKSGDANQSICSSRDLAPDTARTRAMHHAHELGEVLEQCNPGSEWRSVLDRLVNFAVPKHTRA